MGDAIEYPSNLPRVTLNLLQSLMHKNPARRLGASKDDAEEVKRHPYFTGVDWDALLRKETTPPFVPVIVSLKISKDQSFPLTSSSFSLYVNRLMLKTCPTLTKSLPLKPLF